MSRVAAGRFLKLQIRNGHFVHEDRDRINFGFVFGFQRSLQVGDDFRHRVEAGLVSARLFDCRLPPGGQNKQRSQRAEEKPNQSCHNAVVSNSWTLCAKDHTGDGWDAFSLPFLTLAP